MSNPLGYINHYRQGDSKRVSLPHSSMGHADRAAERVFRATGGECVRVDVEVREVERGMVVDLGPVY